MAIDALLSDPKSVEGSVKLKKSKKGLKDKEVANTGGLYVTFLHVSRIVDKVL